MRLSALRRAYLPEASVSISRRAYLSRGRSVFPKEACLSRGGCICPEADNRPEAGLSVPEGAACVRGGVYRGTSPMRKRPPLGPYSRAVPRILGGSEGGWRFLMSEVPLYRPVRVFAGRSRE